MSPGWTGFTVGIVIGFLVGFVVLGLILNQNSDNDPVEVQN